MRVVLSLLILLGVLMMAAPASAQPSAAATAHSQNVGFVQKVDDRPLKRPPSQLRPAL